MGKQLAILGSTGSIGRQTLEVVAANLDHFQVFALAVESNIELLEEQIHVFEPKLAVVDNAAAADQLRRKIGGGARTRVLTGKQGLVEAVTSELADTVVVACSGIAGMEPTLEAIRAGKRIALANKETLVVAGKIVTREAERHGTTIVPVDSEHSAIFQCLQGDVKKVERLILTASGGPFKGYSNTELVGVLPEMALAHPNWSMGQKISIDSATLMNKGLELIEARWLFDVPYDRIEVLIHPQSVVHSMVEYIDGTVLAQLGAPTMKIPIQYALSWPDRLPNRIRTDFCRLEALTFEQPDEEAFPCLKLARQAAEAGGLMPVILNAANEAAVHLFLERRIPFLHIPRLVEGAMQSFKNAQDPEMETILRTDAEVREATERTARTVNF